MSREVLAPPLQRMGPNRCYRVNQVHEDFGGSPAQAQQQQQQASYREQDLYAEDDDDLDADAGLEELPNSMFQLKMHVPPAFYGGLIGFKGSTKRRIESETGVEIYIPRSREHARGNSKQPDDNIIIKATQRSNVCAARRQLTLMIASLRKRIRPTHFVGISLNSEEIRNNYVDFKKRILAENLPGIDERLFQKESCIHLTLCTCVLLDDAERAKGVELLQACSQFLTELKTPFVLKACGLEIMNDDPSAVRVLYARIESNELQQFVNHVYRHFLKSGLGHEDGFRDPDADVKLHMTVMNSRYRKKQDEQAADNFDAREILKRFGEFNFGTAQINEMHLCVMKSADDGLTTEDFYKITGTLKFGN